MNKKNKRNKNQLVTAISVLLLMILLESMYYGYHIMDNRANLMAQYESEQRQRTELLGHALRGMDEAQMAEFIGESVDTSASSWAFVIKDGKTVFMRDASTTAEQPGVSPESYVDSGDAIVTTADAGDGYTCGIFTLKSYVWQSLAVNDFEFFIIIAVIADFMVFGGMLVQFAGKTRAVYDELEELESELAARNEKFREYEKLTARYEEELARRQPVQEALRVNGASERYRQYRFKFYLNARHGIYENGVLGEIHPHTWEIAVNVVKGRDGIEKFHHIEHRVEEFLEKYQDKILNEVEPFDMVNPTLENISEYFKAELTEILNRNGWIFLAMEMSESPSMSYVASLIDSCCPDRTQTIGALPNGAAEATKEDGL